MKKVVLALAVATALASCNNEKSAPKAAPGFRFSTTKANTITLGTSDTVTLINESTNATSVSWDFGDSRTSSENRFILCYPKAGTYTITLNAKASDGKISTTTKTIKILDRVLKNIVINNIFWNNIDPRFAQAGWPLTETADIYVQVQQLPEGEFYKGGLQPDGPVIYTSPAIKNVFKVTNTPLTINVAGKVALNKIMLLDRRYLLNLVAKNASGDYVLVNNWYSGSYQSILKDDLVKDTFVVSVGLFSSMNMNFDFE